ncbi:putative alcohol dehydrogenase [Xylariaceae sp. FL1272]|nr:putative alcohol dehydrogenase [Xylariaceae sp. FL1272]
MPKIRDDRILFKTRALAVNLTDLKHVEFGWTNVGSRIGCDYAGVVEEIGSKVKDLHRGDRTVPFGTFVLVKASAHFKIPENMSFERAASISVSMFTYESLGLPLPNSPADEPFPVLVHGGSTASGVLGIQLAKASADAIFEYKSPSCGKNVRKLTNNKLKYAWDCVGGGEDVCGKALSSSEPGRYGTINFSDSKLLKINPLIGDPTFLVALDAGDEPHCLRGEIAWVPFQSGKVRLINVNVNRGGPALEGV